MMMMKRFHVAITAILALLLLPGLSAAQGKIGVVDPMQAITEVDEFKEKERELEAELEQQSGRLQQLQQELQQIEQRMQTEGMTMSQQQRQQLQAEGQAKMQQMQGLQQNLQRQAQQQQQQILQAIEPKLVDAIEKIAQEKDLDMVINAQAMMYTHPDRKLDITDEVIQRINESE